jgi:serine/threonine-protein kinase RsbW
LDFLPWHPYKQDHGFLIMQHLDVVSLAFPSKSELIPDVRAAIREYAMLSGFSAKDSQRICLAFEEASTYSISLGFGREDDLLRVRFSRTTLGLHIVIRSRGLPLEDEALPAFDPRRFSTAGDATGLHTFLARHMVDEVTFALLKNGERKITLVAHRPGREGERNKGAQKRTALQGISAGPRERRTLTSHAVRLARPEDSEVISRLALRAHGAVFFQETIYYPARVREMLELGEMVSVVAETANGELMAHCALVADAPKARVRELTYAFLDTRFKSPGVHEDMFALLRESAQRLGLRAMIALAVTNHIHSQRNLLQQGYKENALLLAAGPASQSWRKPESYQNYHLFDFFVHNSDNLLFCSRRILADFF